MKIGRVTISNFRSISNAQLDLQNYGVFFGPNNSGKSNLIDAFLFYFDHLKPTPEMFHHNGTTRAAEIWVEVQYIPDDPSELDDLPEKYKLSDGTYVVRRVVKAADLKKVKYHGYIEKDGTRELDDAEFFGSRNVSKAKMGEVLYIPALRDVAVETKSSGSATFAKLLKDVFEDSIKEKPEYKAFADAVKSLSDSLRGTVEDDRDQRDYTSIANIEQTLQEELSPWNCEIDINLEPLNPDNLSQQASEIRIVEPGMPPLQPQDTGHGLQRALLIALIKIWAEVERKKTAKKMEGKSRKVYRPDLTLILFEEPELYLHPPLQKTLFDDLEILAVKANTQVLVATHSPVFVSAAEENFRCLLRVLKDGNTTLHQVSADLMKELSDEDLKRRFRFTLWLNADRNEAFFADRVVLVEGSTDKAVFQWLMAKHKSDIKGLAAKICDCGSKGNIPYFMKLFSDLAVPHYVLHDDDHDKNDDDKKMNKAIQDARIKAVYRKSVMLEMFSDPESPMSNPVSTPVRVGDCCANADGSPCVIVANEEKARIFGKKPSA